jgi:hypothetical protein
MKYVLSWVSKPNSGDVEAREGLGVFSRWTPSPNATFKEFLGRVDGQGGYAVVETDDPETIARDTAIFGVYFDFEVHPVVEIADTARLGMEAIEFRGASS